VSTPYTNGHNARPVRDIERLSGSRHSCAARGAIAISMTSDSDLEVNNFDLSGLAERWHSDSLFRRVYLRAALGLSLVVALAGVYLLLSQPELPWTQRGFGEWALIIGFGLIAVFVLWGSSSVGPAGPPYLRLVLSGEGLSLEDQERHRLQKLAWSDPRFRLDVYDRSALPPTERDGSPRVFDFVVHVRLGPRTPISQDAFRAIVQQARKHGLEVSRRPAPEGRDQPGGSLVTISARRE